MWSGVRTLRWVEFWWKSCNIDVTNLVLLLNTFNYHYFKIQLQLYNYIFRFCLINENILEVGNWSYNCKAASLDGLNRKYDCSNIQQDLTLHLPSSQITFKAKGLQIFSVGQPKASVGWPKNFHRSTFVFCELGYNLCTLFVQNKIQWSCWQKGNTAIYFITLYPD